MSRVPSRLPLLAVLALAVVALAASPPAARAAGCHGGRAEVRFDDGRLLVTRSARAVDPRTVRERWWSCWRPSGRRSLLADARHGRDADDLSLAAVRRGRFVVLEGAGRLDVYDARRGRTTATASQVGAVRQLVVTRHGRLAVLQDTYGGGRQLWAGSGTHGCLVDAGRAQGESGDVFGDLRLDGEHLAWHRDGITMGQDLSRPSC